jgi:hypothetical protein
MKLSMSILAAGLGLCLALPGAAQDIGVLQSAETNDQGVFKFMAAPLMSFGKEGADDEFGLAARAGYGFTERFDAEAKLGLFENSTLFGLDGELWFLHSQNPDTGLDGSLTAGIHWLFGKDERFDTMGIDLTPQLSGHVSRNLELCGALDASFEKIKDVPAGGDDSYTTLHLVPGLEYRLSDTVDLIGEVGIGLNDDSFTYAGAGIAFYIR